MFQEQRISSVPDLDGAVQCAAPPPMKITELSESVFVEDIALDQN